MPISVSRELTMIKGVLLLVVCALAHIQPGSTDFKIVWVKDVTKSFGINKRTHCDLDLPDDLTFRLSYESHHLTLNLKKNKGINPNADIYVVRKLKDGRSFHEQTSLEKENVAYYQDKKNKAAITVRYSKGPNGKCERVIDGNIRLGDRNYKLRSAETDIKFRHMESSDFLGTPYVLLEQPYIRIDNSAKNKANINEKRVEEGVIDLLRHFPNGQKKQNYVRLQSSNSSVERAGGSHSRDKKDNTKAVYWVEVAVLIDPTVWDFYSELLETNNPQNEDAQVHSTIREVFSHYLNGVNLLYREIDDTGIEISITLRTFFFFKTDEFEHRHSTVKTHKGKTYINSRKYLNDLKEWDKDVILPSQIEYDHAMLFTRHDLYWSSIYDNEETGISYRGHICDKGYRSSVVEMDDFFTTVTNAAHELGHNLGAYHDGDREAKDCNPKDEFIMAPRNKEFKPDEPYSRNPWLFSNCSIQSFKKVLSNKTCVTNKGVFFNEMEWTMHVKKQPGEVYTLNKQCELINGPNSVFCGAVSPAICRFMKCTNPKTNKCRTTNFSAARGTACGKNMWCIEGLCISKDLK